MATIIDPDYLLDSAVNTVGANGNNVYIDPALRTIRLNNGQQPNAGDANTLLDESGVTLQALYSFLKEQWKDDPKNKSLIAYPFPLVAITPEQFEFRFGWQPADDSSRDLLRTAGWREYAANNTTLEKQYLGVISLGSIDGDQAQTGGGDQDKAYYAFFNNSTLAPTSSAADFSFPGPVNQAVKVYENGGTDYRSDILTLFIRQETKTYDQTRTTDIGLTAGTTLPYNVQRFPLSEGADLDATVTDATIITNSDAGEKYDSSDVNGPTIKFLSDSDQSNNFGYTKDLTGGPFGFGIIINAENGTGGDNLSTQELYSWVQYSLRRDVNIEDSAGASKIGKLTDQLLQFVGPTLKTLNATNLDGGGTGVAITNFLTTDVNDLAFKDNLLIERTFPFTAAGSLSFSNEIVLDSSAASFFVYYDHTRSSTVPDLVITGAGTASGDATVDSATFTGTFPVTYGVGEYIRLSGATDPNNNQIYQVTNKRTPSASSISVISFDDLPVTDASSFSATLDEHPINSPDALLVDSAGTTLINTGGISGTLAGPISSYTFEYDFDGNSQGNRVLTEPPEIVIRALGLDNGSYVEATGIIAKATTNTYSVISAIERNYDNPV